jgi:hypothetical protein
LHLGWHGDISRKRKIANMETEFDLSPLRRLRRHHQKRLQRKRALYWAGRATLSKRLLGMVARTPAICTCSICKNPKELSRRLLRMKAKLKSL